MNPNYLSIDELEVECVIRNINGSLIEQLDLLKSSLEQESADPGMVPEKTHSVARKAPQKEFEICSNKLKELKPQVTAIAETDPDHRQDKLKILLSRIVHITGRFQRLIHTSPSCRAQSAHMLGACDKVLDAINSLIDEKLSIDDFERSVSEALEESPPQAHDSSIETDGSTSTMTVQPGTSADAIKNKSHHTPDVEDKSNPSSAIEKQAHLSINLNSDNRRNPVTSEELACFVELARRISIGNNLAIPINTKEPNPIKGSTPEIKTSKNSILPHFKNLCPKDRNIHRFFQSINGILFSTDRPVGHPLKDFYIEWNI